jgi:hypothetical protein
LVGRFGSENLLEFFVVRPARRWVNETPGDTGNEQLILNKELNNRVKRFLPALKHGVELLSLGNSTREAVKDEAMAR